MIKQHRSIQFNYMSIGHTVADKAELWWFEEGRLHLVDANTDEYDACYGAEYATHDSLLCGPSTNAPQGRIDHTLRSISVITCHMTPTTGRRMAMAIRRLQAKFDGYTVHVLT